MTLRLISAYSSGLLTTTEGGAGGIIGYASSPLENTRITIDDSFSRASYGTSGWPSINAYSTEFPPQVSNFSFDATAADTLICDQEEAFSCTVVNESADEDDFFFITTHSPMDSWDFDDVWQEETDALPTLRVVYTYTEPLVTTTPAHGRASHRATLSGEILDNGGAAVTEVGVIYGTTREYGNTVSDEGFFEAGSFDVTVSGLHCGRTYYYRAFAINQMGTTLGRSETFRTSSCDDDTPSSGGGSSSLPSIPDASNEDSSEEATPEDTSSGEESSTEEEEDEEQSPIHRDDATSSYDTSRQRFVAEDSGEVDSSGRALSRVASGWFVRSEQFSTVYYIDSSYVRHPLWDTQTFFTWADSWDDITWVTDATLATMPLGKPVLPKSGVVLVKLESDPSVYAVDEDTSGNSILRRVPSEEDARALFGSSWQSYVIDIPPTIFPHFGKGSPLTKDEAWDAGGMKERALLSL